MKRVLPNIRGKMDAALENELTKFFNSLYDQLDILESAAGISIDSVQPERPSATTSREISRTSSQQNSGVGLASNLYAQPVLGIGGSDPNLRSIIPEDVIHSDMNVTPGAVPVAGYITIKDGFGNSVDILTK